MVKDIIQILLVEDDPDDAFLIQTHLSEVGDAKFEVHHAAGRDEADAYLEDQIEYLPHVVLLDLNLPGSSGLETFTDFAQRWPDKSVIVLTGQAQDEIAYAALREGAQDFLVKEHVDGRSLMRSIRYAIERSRGQRAETALLESQHSVRLARGIQTMLFPDAPPDLPGYDIAGASFPSEVVDGDYFDYLPLKDGKLGIAIGDACGHGLPAALISVRAHACLRSITLFHDNVAQIMALTNRVLADHMAGDRFMSMIMVAIDPKRHQLSYVNAGHPYGQVMDASGQIRAELTSTAYPLGVDGDGRVQAGRPVTLQPGEQVLLWTDGVEEAGPLDGKQYGAQRAIDCIRRVRDRPAEQIIKALHKDILNYCERVLTSDDITAVIIKREG